MKENETNLALWIPISDSRGGDSHQEDSHQEALKKAFVKKRVKDFNRMGNELIS